MLPLYGYSSIESSLSCLLFADLAEFHFTIQTTWEINIIFFEKPYSPEASDDFAILFLFQTDHNPLQFLVLCLIVFVDRWHVNLGGYHPRVPLLLSTTTRHDCSQALSLDFPKNGCVGKTIYFSVMVYWFESLITFVIGRCGKIDVYILKSWRSHLYCVQKAVWKGRSTLYHCHRYVRGYVIIMYFPGLVLMALWQSYSVEC